MPTQPPSSDDQKLTSLLLGQLSPEEADRLATEMIDNSQVTPAAEKLPDDTLLASVKQATVNVDAEADKLASRLVERLQAEDDAPTAAYPEAGETAEPMPTELEYFRVEKEIGRGGMGMVYLARDTRLNRPVAIKTLRSDLAKKPSAKERFLREARVAAALEHESVVPIYYVGEAGGIPFLAMPVLKGQGLDAHLKANGGRLPSAEVIRIASQIAGGLAAAHAVGLIHRDIKPSNVWVDADGRRVRVLDFGLARYEADESHLTVSGMIVGTPAYMAPEQARGRGVDARADLFSLGVVMYQMLTGRRPFTGTDTVSIISSLALDTPPAPNVVNFDVPSELSDLVMRLLEKEPQNRPASATVVREALDTLALAPTEDRTELDFSPPTPPRRQPKPQPKAGRKFPMLPLLVALGLLAVIGGGVTAVYQFVFSTKDGTLVVEVEESADVRFKNGKLQVYDDKGELKYTVEPGEKNKGLPPGKYSVKVVGADGVKLDTDKFEIEKNGKVLVKVTATGPEVVKKPDPVKPDPVKPDPAKPAATDAKYALRFDVHSDGIRWHAVEMPTLKLPTKTPVTIEGWVKMDDPLGGYNNVLFGTHSQLGVGRGGGYAVTQPSGGKESVSTGVPPLDVDKPFFADKTWQHVAVVRDADEVRTYLDGKLAGRAACKDPLAEGTGFVFGNAGNGLSVREVRVSTVARYSGDKFTPESRFTPDKQTLALYHCDEGQGDQVADASGNGHHGKISGFGPDCMTKWVTPDGAAVGPGGPVTLPPSTPGTPLALRKPTWKPGPADNTLPGLATRPAILEGVGRWQVVPTAPPTSAVSFSPDGKWVATADFHSVRIYYAATGEFKAIGKRTNGGQLHGANLGLDWSHDSKWVRVADFRGLGFDNGDLFAPDGTRSPVPYIQHAGLDFNWNPKFAVFACVFHGTQDRISIIDPAKKEPVEIVTNLGVKGKAVWSPDGETVLVVREDKTAQLFAHDGTPGAKLAGEVDPVAPPAWSADSKQIAAMASATEIGFWNKDGTAGAKTGKHEKPILTLHWKPDGKLLAASDAEGKRHFWKTDGTSEAVTDTKDGTPGFVWAKDGKGFFTPGKFWPAVGNPSFTAVQLPGYWAAVSPDQTSVAQAKRGEIVVNELKDGEGKDIGWKVLQTRDGIPWWSADGKRLAVVEQNGVSLYDARDPAKVVRLGGGVGVNGLNRAAFSPKGDRLAVANDIGHLIVCEPTGKPLRVLSGPAKFGASLTDAVHDLQWHPDGKLLAVTTGAATVTVFDTETGKVEATTTVQGVNPGGSAVFSPANPDHILISHPDAAALWRWKVEKDPQQKFDGLGKLVLSPDGKRFLSLTPPNRAGVPAALVSLDMKDRDTAGTKEFVALPQHPGPSLAWHPDGKHLVVVRAGHEGRSITIRSLDGKVVEEIKPDGIDVTWLEWVAPATKQNVLVGRLTNASDTYVFDLTTKKLTPFGKVAGELAVSPDGKHLIALEGSSLTYWNLDTKAVEQRVVLLPNGEFVTLSIAGEVLEKSANADNFFRYVVEDKTGKLLVKTPAEMAANLPKSTGIAPLDPEWVTAVAALPPDKQYEAVIAEVKVRNPEFSGKGPRNGRVIEQAVLVELTLDGKLADVTPVRALPGLKRLSVCNTPDHNATALPLADLTQFQGMKLTHLSVWSAAATDLTPLKGLPLTKLDLFGTKVTDLTPLAGMPLEYLDLRGCPVQDLTPIKGLKLKVLGLLGTQVSDLKVVVEFPLESLECGGRITDLTLLKGKKLKLLRFDGDVVSDLSPLKGMPLEQLGWWGSKVTDLSPLEGMPLKALEYELNLDRDGKILRSLKSLETINGKPVKDVLK